MKELAAALAAATLTACAPAPRIERADVERVLESLAADSMQGRRAFTPGADRAAAFIRVEFADIGLDRLQGLDDYLQVFSVYSLTLDSARVVLNGRRIPSRQTAISLWSPSLHWKTGDSVRIVTIGPAAQAREAVSLVFQGGGNALVLVHPSQRRLFERLQGFAGRSWTMQPRDQRSLVFVLTEDGAARSFRVDATASVDTVRAANVVGVIPGRRPDQLVLFSAHYDHLGIQPPVNGDSVANGANDDASGTAAVIELARYFKAKGLPQRTLVFAAFTAEEAGGFGSQYFSGRLNPNHIVAMFNIEMIGKPAASGPNHAWITGFERSSFGTIVQNSVRGTGYVFEPDPYPQEQLFYRSDNAALARLGVPAHSISTTPIDVDRDYHQVTDEVRTLDLDHLTNTIRAIAAGASTIVAGRATPTRVDTTQTR